MLQPKHDPFFEDLKVEIQEGIEEAERGELVDQEVVWASLAGLIDKAAFLDAAVVRLMMLETEVSDVVAQRVEKMIVAIVVRAKKFLRLIDETPVVVPNFLRSFESCSAIGGNVHLGNGILRQRNDFQKFSGDYRRIDQCRKRNGVKVNFVSAVAGDR